MHKCITGTNVMENIKLGEIPKPSRTHRPPPLVILLGIHVFIYWNLILKIKVKDRKAKNFISEKTVSLRTLITSFPFFVSDLKYQMKVLSVEWHQSYSWSQDRMSLEYWVENQIANWLIATKKKPRMKRKIALSFNYCLKHKI